jgi:hypothetical protein
MREGTEGVCVCPCRREHYGRKSMFCLLVVHGNGVGNTLYSVTAFAGDVVGDVGSSNWTRGDEGRVLKAIAKSSVSGFREPYTGHTSLVEPVDVSSRFSGGYQHEAENSAHA